jgi:hypothetical protein
LESAKRGLAKNCVKFQIGAPGVIAGKCADPLRFDRNLGFFTQSDQYVVHNIFEGSSKKPLNRVLPTVTTPSGPGFEDAEAALLRLVVDIG